MSNKDTQKQIYRDCRNKTGLKPSQWGHLFSLGGTGGHKEVGKKELQSGEANSRGVNMPEALASQLLLKLDTEGFDIASINFNEDGLIIYFPKKSENN